MTTTFWPIIGTVLVMFATVALLFALFARRIAWWRKSQRRCPRCWYDMSHTAGRQCPECGRTWKRESKLYTFRRRRLAFVVALLLFVLAIPTRRADEIAARGWVGGVPSPVIVMLSPWLFEFDGLYDEFFIRIGLRPKPATWDGQLRHELMRRVRDDAYSDLEWWCLVESALSHARQSPMKLPESSDVLQLSYAESVLHQAVLGQQVSPRQRNAISAMSAVRFTMRSTWPPDATMFGTLHVGQRVPTARVRIRVTNAATGQLLDIQHVGVPLSGSQLLMSNRFVYDPSNPGGKTHADDEHLVTLGSAPGDEAPTRFAISVLEERDGGAWVEVAEHIVERTVTVRGTDSDYLTLTSSPALDAALRSISVAHRDPSHPEGVPEDLLVPIDAIAAILQRDGIDILAARLEITRGATQVAAQDVVYRTFASNARHTATSTPPAFEPTFHRDLRMLWRTAVIASASDGSTERFTLHISSTTDGALCHPKHQRVWSGAVEVPLMTWPPPEGSHAE